MTTPTPTEADIMRHVARHPGASGGAVIEACATRPDGVRDPEAARAVLVDLVDQGKLHYTEDGRVYLTVRSANWLHAT